MTQDQINQMLAQLKPAQTAITKILVETLHVWPDQDVRSFTIGVLTMLSHLQIQLITGVLHVNEREACSLLEEHSAKMVAKLYEGSN